MKINLGCGNDIRDGWVNCDKYSDDPRVTKIDLNVLPLPFDDEVADYIYLSHVLEHLTVHPFEFLVDCHRILKKDGVLEVHLPPFGFYLPHTRGYHPDNYLSTLYTVAENEVNACYHQRCRFTLESKKSDFSIIRLVVQLKNVLKAMSACESCYVMKKK